MLKIALLFLSSFVLSNTVFANNFTEKKLGNAIATERSYKMNLNDISNNLQEPEKLSQTWISEVILLTDKSIILSVIGDNGISAVVKDSSAILKETHVVFIPTTVGYRVLVGVGYTKVNKDIVMAAIEKAFKDLNLSNKPLVIRFLKVE